MSIHSSPRLFFTLLFLLLCHQTNIAHAQIQLKLGTTSKANPMIAGVNNNFIRGDMPYDDPGFRNIIKATNVTTLRYPGGTSGSLFDWQTNQFVADDLLYSYGPKSWHRRHGEMKRRIAKAPANTFSADNFAQLCKATDTQPVWIPNPVTVSPDSNVKFFEYLKAHNLPCPYVEMGNECSGGAFRKRFQTGKEYADAIRPVMQKIKALYPNAKIAVVGNGHAISKIKKQEQESGTADKRGSTWNNILMQDSQYFDGIVLHSYGVSPERLRQYPADQWSSFTLAYPGAYMQAAAERSRQKYNAKPIWLTEYNAAFHHLMEARPRKYDDAEDFFGKVSDSSMHGLMIASYIIGAINDPQMWPVMHYHSLSGPAGFRLVRRIDGQWHMGPKAHIFSKLAQIIRQAKKMYPVTALNSSTLDFTVLNEKPLPTITAAMLENDSQRNWLIMNRSNKPQTINLPWQQADHATVKHLHGKLAPENPDQLWQPVNTDMPNKTKRVQRNKQKQLTQTIPPYCLSIVSLPQ